MSSTKRVQLDSVYPITESGNRSRFNHVQLAEKFLQGGVRCFQVRDKTLPDSMLFEQLIEIRRLCRFFKARFLVNDRVDLALAAKADGVHLGQTDLPVQQARRLLGRRAIIGLSTHTEEEFLQAQSGDLDYVALGPIFATSTKRSDDAPLGLEEAARLAAQSPLPVVAIGGITLEKAAALWEAGIQSVAVISDIVKAADPARRVREYLNLARRVRRGGLRNPAL